MMKLSEGQVLRLRYAAHLNPGLPKQNTDLNVSFLPMEAIGEDGSLRLDQVRPLSEVAQGFTPFQNGDVLVAKITPCYENGKGALARNLTNGIGYGTTELHVLRPKSGIDARFLWWVTTSEPFREQGVAAMTGAAGQQRVPEQYILDYKQFFPPLEQQRLLAAYLDRETARIDDLIAVKEELLQTLAEKRQALITRAVTRGLDASVPLKNSGLPWLGEIPAHWSVVRLKHLAQRVGSGKTPLGGAEVYVTEGVTFLRSQNVYDDGLRLDDVAFISEDIDAAMASTRVRANDILLNITGASLGRTCLVPDGLGPANVNQHVCIIRLKNADSTPYIALAMKTQPTKHQISALENGTSREGLNFEQIGNITLAYPPSAEEREHIAGQISAYMTRIGVIQKATVETIQMLQQRRAAVIAAAVTGQIEVGDMA